METVTTRLSADDIAALDEFGAEIGVERPELLRRLIRRGLNDWRREQALEGLQEQTMTVRQAAEHANVSYVEMLSIASEAGIAVAYSMPELERDLDRI